MTDEELKRELMKVDKEVLVEHLVRINPYSNFAFEGNLRDLHEMTKLRKQSRKLDRILKEIDEGNQPKKRKNGRRRVTKIR